MLGCVRTIRGARGTRDQTPGGRYSQRVRTPPQRLTSLLLGLSPGLAVALAVVGLSCDSSESPCVEGRPSGVMLSFDDEPIDSWVAALPMFKEQNARVTFFVRGKTSIDLKLAKQRLTPLVAAGHSLGVHTWHHRRAPEEFEQDPQAYLRDEVQKPRTVLETLLGHPVVAFAYPHGNRSADTDAALTERFHLVRGFVTRAEFTTERELTDGGFVYSTSIDNIHHVSHQWITTQLTLVSQRRCTIWPVTSHEVGPKEWGILPEDLRWFLSEVRRLGLQFYVPEDFIQPNTAPRLQQ